MRREIELKVNGRTYEVEIHPWQTLVDALRNQLHLTGTKESCLGGHCGACTVIVDGEAVNSCLTLAVESQGKEITTIEGVADGSELHPIQKAFVNHGAVQCGFCTPGLVMATKTFLARNPDPSEEQIQMTLSGHRCRCTGYVQIIEAVRAAAEMMGASKTDTGDGA